MFFQRCSNKEVMYFVILSQHEIKPEKAVDILNQDTEQIEELEIATEVTMALKKVAVFFLVTVLIVQFHSNKATNDDDHEEHEEPVVIRGEGAEVLGNDNHVVVNAIEEDDGHSEDKHRE